MTGPLLASALCWLVLSQGMAASPKASPSPAVLAAPSEPILKTPTDDLGPHLKAWLDASRLHDADAGSAALKRMQKLRAERNLVSVDDVAGAMAGRAEAQAGEGNLKDSLNSLQAAIGFAPDDSALAMRVAAAKNQIGGARAALDLAEAHPFERGRLQAMRLLGLLVALGLFAMGFSLSLLFRYAAVFSHDVAEGLSGPLKPLALFMAVLFLALPLAGFMGWGYLPFWWITLFFIFESRAEKVVSILLLVALALSSLALPFIAQQSSFDAASTVRRLYEVASGSTSAEGEDLVRRRAVSDSSDADAALLSAAIDRRAGRMIEAEAALLARAESDARFAHNAAALEFNKTNYAGAAPGFARAAESVSSPLDKATALYNQSLVQVNTLAFDASKESRKKADAIAPAATVRFDRLFTFDRDGSMLQAPPDILPSASKIVEPQLPRLILTADNLASRLLVVAVGFLIFIPLVVRFRGAQSFSKQCPKCGTTFCWLCQTRSTSQDVCSQCHHLFVVKRGIPPAARAAKTQEISRYSTRRSMRHRLSSLLAPGAGHLSVGHFVFGLPVLLLWAASIGVLITLTFLAPNLVTGSPLASAVKLACMGAAALAYLGAQIVKPKAPVVAPAPRRTRPGQEA